MFNVVEYFSLKHGLKVILGLNLSIIGEVLAVDPEPVDNLGQLLVWRVFEIFDIF